MKIITAGIDVGNKYTKVIIMKDNKILSRGMIHSGFDLKKSIEEAFDQALCKGGIEKNKVQFVMATGAGKAEVTFAGGTITDIGADALGALYFFPSGRIIVDVGAEHGRAIKINRDAKVIDFAINDKCAAGAGSFVEAMSRVLEIPIDQFGDLSLQSDKTVPMNAQCAVFAESEVVSLIHAKVPKKDIAKAVLDAIAGRIISMVRRVGMEKEIVLTGGLSRNVGFIRSMEDGLEVKTMVPENPEFITALGASIAAKEKI